MSKDTIYREDAIKAVSKVDDYGDGIGFEVRSHCLVELELVPSADRPTEVIYGNEHNCIMTIFGECSYAETGCGDCAVVEKVRKALSADRPQGEVNAVEIYERAEHNLEQGYITIGEFDKRIEPLRHLCYDRPQGEWIGCRHEDSEWLSPMADFYKCSICGKIVNLLQMRSYNFCPNCGADMREVDDERPD